MNGGAHYRRSLNGILQARTVGGVQKDATQGRKLEEPWKGRPFTNFGWGYFIPIRSIYGLKQTSRSWNIHFDGTIKSFSFIKNMDKPYAYKKSSGSTIVFLILYVDDILLIGNDILMLQSVKT